MDFLFVPFRKENVKRRNYFCSYTRGMITVGFFCLLLLSAAKGQTNYNTTDLGYLGGQSITANSINKYGEVVGYGLLPDGSTYHAFLYSKGKIRDLDTLRGDVDSIAYSINDSSEIVGLSFLPPDARHAFLYRNGKMKQIGVGTANAINDLGEVAINNGPDFGQHAFLYRNGIMKDLGTLGGSISQATGNNNNSQVVGGSVYTTSILYHAFLYINGHMTDLGKLGFLASLQSWATGISDHGQVVGYSYTVINNYVYHAFLYSGGIILDLGALNLNGESIAYGINNHGDVVGVFYSNTGSGGFLYSGGLMRDLNSFLPINSGWVLGGATGINDQGQICGGGNHNGQTQAYLMTPKR